MEQEPSNPEPLLNLLEIEEIFQKNCGNSWCFVKKETYFKFCKVEENDFTLNPQVSYMVLMCLTTGATSFHYYGQQLDLEKMAFASYDAQTKTLAPERDKIQGFISKLKSFADEKSSVKDILRLATTMIEACLEKVEMEMQPDNENLIVSNLATLRFICEQLELVSTGRRKYSPAMIRLAMMIKFYSSSGYSALRDCKFIILPSDTTLRSYTVPRREKGINQLRLEELTRLASSLHQDKRHVSIIFDEMALQPNVNFDQSGNMEGFAINSPSDKPELATSMLCFMLQGLKQNYHEIVSFHPVHKLPEEFLEKCFRQVVHLVMKAGFHPCLSVCDNCSVNRKLYRNISGKTDEQLKTEPVMTNPYDQSKKMVLIHNSVHLLKCIRNNWFRRPTWEMSNKEEISWSLLEKLRIFEEELPIRKAFPLSMRALKPNNIDKQKVKLAYNVVSWRVRNALISFSDLEPEKFPKHEVRSTVKFMDAVRTFFDILNINHIGKGPISSESSEKIRHLEEVRNYFEEVQECGIFTQETFQALLQTINGSIIIIKVLLQSEPGKVQVFTARFQQDPLEEHFGHQRFHSGCAYRITPQQFANTERKLTNLASLNNNSTSSTYQGRKSTLEWNDEPFLHSCLQVNHLTKRITLQVRIKLQIE